MLRCWCVLKPIALGLLGMLALLMLAGLLLGDGKDTDRLAEALDAERIGVDGARLLLMTVLVTCWGPLVRWRGRQHALAEHRIEQLTEHRWTLALCLLAVELVLVQRCWEWLL